MPWGVSNDPDSHRHDYRQNDHGEEAVSNLPAPRVNGEGRDERHDRYAETAARVGQAQCQTAPPIVVPMTAPGAIAGRVLDKGRPARRIWLRALKASYIDGRRSMRVITFAQSDDRGEFRLFG